jgi:hypothetical protein
VKVAGTSLLMDDLARKNGGGDGPAEALAVPSAADLAAAEVRGGKGGWLQLSLRAC